MSAATKTLSQTVERFETAIVRELCDCALQLRFPMNPQHAADLQRGLTIVSSLRQELASQINKQRFGHLSAGDTSGNRPFPANVDGMQNAILPPLHSVNLLDAWLQRLAEVTDRLSAILARGPQPLYAEIPPPADLRAEQLAISERVFIALHRVVNPTKQDTDSAALGCLPDIPLAPSEFVAHAHAAYRVGIAQERPKLRFLDVGCGGGVKVMMAAEIFDRADGLDFDPGYVAAAKAALALVETPNADVFQSDAMGFGDYGAYDVIYFYQPMRAESDLVRLECHIAERSRPGTILIAPYLHFARRASELGCGRVAGAVYVVGTGQDQADALREAAETTGTSLVRPDTRIEACDSHLAPLILAARRIGFDIG